MIKISVCVGSACHRKGSYNVINSIQQQIENRGLEDRIQLNGTFCTENCGSKGVAVLVNDQYYGVDPSEADKFFDDVIVKML